MTTEKATEKKRAILALALLVPLASVGTASALVLWPGTGLGVGVFATEKALFLAFPAVWHRHVDGRRSTISRPTLPSVAWGAATGVLIAGATVAAYFAIGPSLLDRERLREAVARARLGWRGLSVAGAVN